MLSLLWEVSQWANSTASKWRFFLSCLGSAHWSVYREGRFSMWQSPSLIGYASCENSFTWQTSVKLASCSKNGRTDRYSVHSYLGTLPFIKYTLWKCYLTRLVWPNVYKNGRTWKKTINRFRWGVFLSPVLITQHDRSQLWDLTTKTLLSTVLFTSLLFLFTHEIHCLLYSYASALRTSCLAI